MSGAGTFCCALVLASHPALNATTTAAVISTVRMDSIWSVLWVGGERAQLQPVTWTATSASSKEKVTLSRRRFVRDAALTSSIVKSPCAVTRLLSDPRLGDFSRLADALDGQRLPVRRHRAVGGSKRPAAHLHNRAVVMIVQPLDRHRLARGLSAD